MVSLETRPGRGSQWQTRCAGVGDIIDLVFNGPVEKIFT